MNNIEIDFSLKVSSGEETTFITEGSYEKNKDIVKINFIEQTDLPSNTTVYIYNNRVIIKREGVLKMNMIYIEGEETTVNLITDFNYQLTMRNFTRTLEITDNGILIKYQTETDLEQDITHTLSIKWKNIN